MLFLIGPPLSGIALYAERLTVGLGYLTLFFALSSFASCRTCVAWFERFGIKNLTTRPGYRRFFNLHGYFWYGFLLLLFVHAVAAIMHTALPNAKDPDGFIHLIILVSGLAAMVLTILIFASCRSLVSLIKVFYPGDPLRSLGYRAYYRFHGMWWALLFATIAGHFISDYLHIGFWPV